MSYPPELYHGDTGEVSATFRPASAPPDLVYPESGTAVDYLATGEATQGLFGLYRWTMTAARSGPGPHFHRTLAESFYVLTGSIRVWDGTAWRDAGPGDFVHVPPGGIHGFRNESGAPASMLIHFAPGAPREGYFEGLARPVGAVQPDAEALARFYAEHDNTWV
jgi:mannose-6-phosphate isomerase-like protein (cupin superfamily)